MPEKVNVVGSRNNEELTDTSEAFVDVAMTRLMLHLFVLDLPDDEFENEGVEPEDGSAEL